MIHNSTRGCQHNIAKLSGRKKVVGHFSMSPMPISKRGEMTPHLFRRPVRLTTIFPDLWSSTTNCLGQSQKNAPKKSCVSKMYQNQSRESNIEGILICESTKRKYLSVAIVNECK